MYLSLRDVKQRKEFDAWWRSITLKGDPLRRPCLTGEAFDAGFEAARQAVYAELAVDFTERACALIK